MHGLIHATRDDGVSDLRNHRAISNGHRRKFYGLESLYSVRCNINQLNPLWQCPPSSGRSALRAAGLCTNCWGLIPEGASSLACIFFMKRYLYVSTPFIHFLAPSPSVLLVTLDSHQ